MSTKFTVTLDEYTERHFAKSFVKKYSPKAWQITETAMRALCTNFEELVKLNLCDTISHVEQFRLCKVDFSVAGTNKSPKQSANRYILVADMQKMTVRILLIYHKSDIVKSGNETVAWKQIIKQNFPEYTHLLN